jgi:hypothetical protein
MRSTVRRHPRLFTLAALGCALVLAAPLVAYVIVPALVRSTLVEPLPAATPAAIATGAPDVTSAPEATPATLARGELVRITAVDYGSGVVRIIRSGSDSFVRFEDVDIAGAPNMYVYLSDRSDGKPGAYVDLGKLKATNGSFNYQIPPGVDIAAVHSVVVWCRQFSVTVTYAVVTPP